MHEFSVSSEIVQTVLDATQKSNGKKVLSIQIEIGELTLLNVEQIAYWIHELFKGSMAEGAKVKLKKIKARIRCGECQYGGKPNLNHREDYHHLIQFSCPKCGSIHIIIEKGRECVLKRIQVLR
ncbi:MAG: hydrogenase maturation nickel metallochaperone HypA [Thermodesulfobacteriota bacterium]